MTEKRYKLSEPNGAYLIDNDRPYAHWINDDDKIIDLLNALHEENEQLKTQLVSINQLIDNKIDEFRNGDYGDLPCSTIHMFLDLKQELGDLE